MLRYILRRMLYMIPTILGVILITFILFNVAGGDPARLKLGQQDGERCTHHPATDQRDVNRCIVAGLGHDSTVSCSRPTCPNEQQCETR